MSRRKKLRDSLIQQKSDSIQQASRKIEVKFRTKSQEQLWSIFDRNEITLVSGPAGTGKTYLSILKSIELILKDNSKYKKIIIIKPVVEADEKLGALPGTLEEKLEPYVYSYMYLFEKIIGKPKLQRMLENETIKMMALAYLRGINIDNSIVIFDEAQNCTGKQMRTLLTRIGENSKYFILGDIEQSDRFSDKNAKESGFSIAIDKLHEIDGIDTFSFKKEDIVRNKIISKILDKLNGSIK